MRSLRRRKSALEKHLSRFASQAIRKAKRVARETSHEIEATIQDVRNILPAGKTRTQRERQLKAASREARKILKASLNSAADAFERMAKKLSS
jgi:hypothetical protein